MTHPRVYAVFENTHATLKAEKALKNEGLDIRTAMKPSGIGPGCQMALTLPEVSASLAAHICVEAKMKAPLFFRKAGQGKWEAVEPEDE